MRWGSRIAYGLAVFGLIIFVLIQQLHIEYLESRINDVETTMQTQDKINARNIIYLYKTIGDFK